MSTEFEIDDHHYRIIKMSAMKQMHLSRKLAPLIPPLVPVMLKMANSKDRKDFEAIASLLGPFADGLERMDDAAAEYLINTCMAAVQVKTPTGDWVKAWNVEISDSAQPQLKELGTVLKVVVKVVWDTLGPFISGLLSAPVSQEAAGASKE